MQNGVFLHTKEDVNTGCLRTLFLITLFKFTTDVIDDFKERHYWSTSQTSHIDCKSRMNKSFFFSSPPLSPPLRERLYNQSISVTYMGSSGAKSPLLKSSPSKDASEQWLLNRGTLGDLQGVTSDVTLKSHCLLIYQMWNFIHPFINLRDPLQIGYMRWSPQREKVSGAAVL